MKTHQRFIATAAIVGAALLSPAEGTVRAAAAAASSVVERNEFGGAAVPVPDDASIPRAPAGADGANMEEVSGRRRLMWWNWMAALVGPDHPCPPGPLGKKCRDEKEAAAAANGGGGNSGSVTPSGSDTDVSRATDSDNPVPSTAFGATPSSMIALVAAAVAAGTAIAAAVIGSRRRDTRAAHPLQGSVKNRMRLFGNFADRNLVGKTERPCGRVVEMSSPPIVDDAHYNEMA